jgi:hypothetical protein
VVFITIAIAVMFCYPMQNIAQIPGWALDSKLVNMVSGGYTAIALPLTKAITTLAH